MKFCPSQGYECNTVLKSTIIHVPGEDSNLQPHEQRSSGLAHTAAEVDLERGEKELEVEEMWTQRKQCKKNQQRIHKMCNGKVLSNTRDNKEKINKLVRAVDCAYCILSGPNNVN